VEVAAAVAPEAEVEEASSSDRLRTLVRADPSE
jgi:hypothetical protein